MHKPESVKENETRKMVFNFWKETDHLIPVRRPDQEIVNKKKGGNLP